MLLTLLSHRSLESQAFLSQVFRPQRGNPVLAYFAPHREEGFREVRTVVGVTHIGAEDVKALRLADDLDGVLRLTGLAGKELEELSEDLPHASRDIGCEAGLLRGFALRARSIS